MIAASSTAVPAITRKLRSGERSLLLTSSGRSGLLNSGGTERGAVGHDFDALDVVRVAPAYGEGLELDVDDHRRAELPRLLLHAQHRFAARAVEQRLVGAHAAAEHAVEARH